MLKPGKYYNAEQTIFVMVEDNLRILTKDSRFLILKHISSVKVNQALFNKYIILGSSTGCIYSVLIGEEEEKNLNELF